MTEKPLLEKLKIVQVVNPKRWDETEPMNVVDALRKFQDILNFKLRNHEKILKHENCITDFIHGEISMINEILELSNKVFGVLDSQNNLNEVKKL
jgi:hypothetical protein